MYEDKKETTVWSMERFKDYIKNVVQKERKIKGPSLYDTIEVCVAYYRSLDTFI